MVILMSPNLEKSDKTLVFTDIPGEQLQSEKFETLEDGSPKEVGKIRKLVSIMAFIILISLLGDKKSYAQNPSNFTDKKNVQNETSQYLDLIRTVKEKIIILMNIRYGRVFGTDDIKFKRLLWYGPFAHLTFDNRNGAIKLTDFTIKIPDGKNELTLLNEIMKELEKDPDSCDCPYLPLLQITPMDNPDESLLFLVMDGEFDRLKLAIDCLGNKIDNQFLLNELSYFAWSCSISEDSIIKFLEITKFYSRGIFESPIYINDVVKIINYTIEGNKGKLLSDLIKHMKKPYIRSIRSKLCKENRKKFKNDEEIFKVMEEDGKK